MKAPKQTRSRHKLSFAVDRAEIDISSDWVQAVMDARATAVDAKTATVASLATAEKKATVAENATVAKNATAANIATGALLGGMESATVAKDSTVAGPLAVADTATVVHTATVAPKTQRSFRLRPIRRITDGLTPGQFAVYSLLFEKGEPDEQPGRLFRGGYLDICLLTGLSKRGVQNVVAELQAKQALAIHQSPGYHRSQTTVYRVPPEDAVLEAWFARGWLYAVGKSKALANIATVVPSATE